jgi:Tol biopolymer transport system component
MRLKPKHYTMLFLSVVIAILAAGQHPTSEDDAPRGAFIVYTSAGFNGIYITRPDGTDARKIDLPTQYVGSVDCDYASHKLVGILVSGSTGGLYTLDFDGSELKRIPAPADFTVGVLRDVAFAPDGQRVIYTQGIERDAYPGKKIEQRLIVGDLKQQTWRILLNTTDTTFYAPQWSPDGQQIVYGYITRKDGLLRQGIGLVGADGSANHPVLTSTTWLGNPDWSPDGRSIVVSHAAIITIFARAGRRMANGSALAQTVMGRRGIRFSLWMPPHTGYSR